MAPALTQAVDPPILAEATHNTSPPPSALPATEGIQCLKSYKKLVSLKSLLNGNSCAAGLAPPACGWAEGRPSSPPVSYTMEDLPPRIRTFTDGGRPEEQPTQLPQADVSALFNSTSIQQTPPLNMGYQTPNSVLGSNVNEPADNSPQPQHIQTTHINPPQGELLDFAGKDFNNVSDLIDTLQILVGKPELLNSTTQQVNEPENGENRADMEHEAATSIAELVSKQKKLERKKVFLMRRLRRVTARGLGSAVSAQLNHLVREGRKSLEQERDNAILSASQTQEPLSIETLPTDSMKNMTTTDLVTLVRRVEASQNMLRKNAAARDIHKIKQIVPALSEHLCAEADVVCAEMKAAAHEHLHHDSDATESSSGGESCDESDNQEENLDYRPIKERAFYKYFQRRGWIASKWTWLQTQLGDIDHKISTQKQYHQQLRATKGPVTFADEPSEVETGRLRPRSPAHFDIQDPALTCVARTPNARSTVNGYHPFNKVDESSVPIASDDSCARTRSVLKVKRRRYVRPSAILKRNRGANSGTLSNKISPTREKTKSCTCVLPASCLLCVKLRSKVHYLQGNALMRYMKLQTLVDYQRPPQEKMGNLDPSHHPVLSDPNAATLQTEIYSRYLHSNDWQDNMLSSLKNSHKRDLSPQVSEPDLEPLLKRKRKELKKNGRRRDDSRDRSASSQRRQQLSDNDFDEEIARWHSIPSRANSRDSPCASPAFDKIKPKHDSDNRTNVRKQSHLSRNKQNHNASSFDINNIVIPYSMAAVTTVESLDYKEILTPEWRILDLDPLPINAQLQDQIYAEEDITDVSFTVRHNPAQENERKKFFRGVGMKANSRPCRSRRIDSSGTNTPDHPLSPRISESSPVGSPLPGPSEDSNHSTSTIKSNNSQIPNTVITLALSSLQTNDLNSNRSLSDVDESVPEELDSVDSNSFVSGKGQSAHSSSVCLNPRARRIRSTASQEFNFTSDKTFRPINSHTHIHDGSELEMSPFPSRNFPLNENDLGDMLSDEGCDDFDANSMQGDLETDQITFSLQNLPQCMDETGSSESGRASPLSEVTDSAPEEDVRDWDDSEPPDWTISAISNPSGGCMMQVQRH